MTPLSQKVFEIRVTPLGLGIILSILIHLFLLFIHLKKQSDLLDARTPEPFEVSQISPEQLKELEKQVVEAQKLDNNDIDPNARFYSDRNQTAKKQTKAATVDDFKKSVGNGVPKVSGQESAEPSPKELSDLAIPNEEKNQKTVSKKDWKSLSLKDLGVQGETGPQGATDDHVKNVDPGEDTILSTREFRYFSYYHRIKELLRQHWKPNIEAKLYKMWQRGRSINSDEFTTKVLVLLNETGNIKRISKVASCGVTELDEAAIEAFEKAGPFPNPPKGIVDSDGFVRIRWDFILQTEATPRIQFQSSGSDYR